LRRAMRPKAQKDSAAALSRHTTSAADRAGLVVPVGERRDLRGGALAATVGVQDHLIGHLPGDEEGRSFSKTHGPNVIRRSLGADAPALRAHQHQAPRQYRHRGHSFRQAHPTPQRLFTDTARPPHAPPDGRSLSPGGQPAPKLRHQSQHLLRRYHAL